MTRFTWLHLSDFHFRGKDHWQRDHVTRTLIRNVIEQLTDEDLQPDVVFATGDIAQSGSADEYQSAHAAFTDLAQKLALEPEKTWFVVPGNHDVNRNAVGPLARGFRNLLDEDNAAEIMTDPRSWALFAERQEAFFDFTGAFLGEQRRWQPDQPWRCETFVKGGRTIGIASLNSAWCCQDDGDREKILIGEYQMAHALRQLGDAEIRIALCHHPLTDLAPYDQDLVQGYLNSPDGFHFLLRGHLHQSRINLQQIPGGGTVELAAGACWQDARAPHAVMVGQLDLAAGCMSFHIWSYTPNNGGFWTRDNKLYRGMPYGRADFDFLPSW